MSWMPGCLAAAIVEVEAVVGKLNRTPRKEAVAMLIGDRMLDMARVHVLTTPTHEEWQEANK